MQRFQSGPGFAGVLLAGVLCCTATAEARRVIVPVSKDNTLFGPFNASFSNGAGPSVFAGSTRNFGPRRALLQFALTDSVPSLVQIDSVQVRLHLNRTTTGTTVQALHRLLQEWGEAGSISIGGAGVVALAGDATWSHAFFDSVAWNTPGGDFAPTPSATASVGSDTRDYFWRSTPALVADVQAWVDDPAANFGWILIGDEGTSSAKRFDSRQSVLPELRPELIIDYSPRSPVEVRSWSWAKQHLSRRGIAASPKRGQ
jgi:hypothetical protein